MMGKESHSKPAAVMSRDHLLRVDDINLTVRLPVAQECSCYYKIIFDFAFPLYLARYDG